MNLNPGSYDVENNEGVFRVSLHLPRSKVKTVVHTYPDAGVENMFDRRYVNGRDDHEYSRKIYNVYLN